MYHLPKIFFCITNTVASYKRYKDEYAPVVVYNLLLAVIISHFLQDIPGNNKSTADIK